MPVSESDVRHVAALARLGIEDERIPTIAAELNGILGHMEILSRVDTSAIGVGGRDEHTHAVPREAFAPAMQDGFLLVPRLATHEDQDAESP